MKKTGLLVCLLLILPLAGTVHRTIRHTGAQPRTTFREGSSRRAALQSRLKECAAAFRSTKYSAAAQCFESGFQTAKAENQIDIAARFLANLGACHLALHRYQHALQRSFEARKLAEAAGDAGAAGGVEANIASIYEQMGETDAAIEWAKRGLARISGADREKHLPKVLIQLASLNARQGRMAEAAELFRRGIEGAARIGDLDTYALGWDRLGEERLRRHELPEAEYAMLEAFRVRKLNRLAALDASYRNLGSLLLATGDVRTAGALLEEAVLRSRAPRGLIPTWDIYYARARVRLAEGRLEEALEDFRVTARLLAAWRRGVSPADATRASAEQLVESVYAGWAETATALYFRTRRAAYAREAFEAIEENRAASLRALVGAGGGWQRRLPPEYWETLARLQAAEIGLLRNPGPGPREPLAGLRAELIGMEGRAGATVAASDARDLLRRAQRALPAGAAYLSFHLAEPRSFLCALDSAGLALYALPGRQVIASAAKGFVEELRGGAAGGAAGLHLYRTLFGPLEPRFHARARWLLGLEEDLFEVPYAALATSGAGEPLAARHATQVVANAGLLGRGAWEGAGGFVGIGDAIYNAADPRWTARTPRRAWPLGLLSAAAPAAGPLLPRLPGSRREIELCAAAWNAPRPVLLDGRDASPKRLRAALENRPAVVHFATHVLASADRTRHGLIALSLGEGGRLEILEPREIAAWQVPPALVVLSGCGSGAGAAPRGSGLMGLTRAWLAAGAAGVVATHWPTPDDHGTLLAGFYRHLRDAAPPAVALQRAQLEMLRSGGWRSEPRYWSAYFLAGTD